MTSRIGRVAAIVLLTVQTGWPAAQTATNPPTDIELPKRIEAWIRRTAKGYRAKGFPTVLVARNGDEVRIAGSKVLPTAEQFPTVLARFATKWGVPVEALAAI